ncbi:MAG: Maf family protein [Candidatus Eisenbacteria bacterium]|nr:Maf family protein [Candidatus Eisenbacteria bacterium]
MFPDLGGKFLLASKSPRRAELLKLVGVKFETAVSFVNEDNEKNLSPGEHVTELARKKALSIAAQVEDGSVLGADTIVLLEGEILGKPESRQQATQMLRSLSGKWHEVFTGIALVSIERRTMLSSYERTRVKVKKLTSSEIESYVDSGEPMDKAGSYGIQGLGAIFIEKVDGCYFNVMGLPVSRLYSMALKMKTCLPGS